MAAAAGVYFYLYSKLRTWALEALQARGKAMTGDIGVGPSLLVAFLAGCGNVLATNPIWVVSTRMQVTSGYEACSPACADLFGACAGWLQGGSCGHAMQVAMSQSEQRILVWAGVGYLFFSTGSGGIGPAIRMQDLGAGAVRAAKDIFDYNCR